MVKDEHFIYKCCHFPAQMPRLRIFCRENVKNAIYALWWAGLAQNMLMVGRLDNSGAGPDIDKIA